MKKDNRGLSLVELLVAISIAAIISGSIAYLLRTSLHLYGNETTDVALQQELQVTLNQIMDYAMESQELVISGTDTATDYVAFGSIIPKASESEPAKFDAVIIWRDDTKLYLKKNEIIDDINKEIEDDTLISTLNGRIATASSTKENYLLAEYVTGFCVSADGIIDGTSNYRNPLSVNIDLQLTKKGSSSDIEKKVSDKAVLRNRIKLPISVNGTWYTLKKESTKLEKITESVQLSDAMTGNVYRVQEGVNTQKTKLTVIEIVPKPSCGLLGYLVGGKEPIDSDGIDACANKYVGHMKYVDAQYPDGPASINSNSQLLTSNIGGNATIPNFYVGSGTYSGYFEKVRLYDGSVRNGRGGVYAVNKNSGMEATSFADLSFISEYTSYDTSKYSKSDFCWVWKETDNIPNEGLSYYGDSEVETEFDQDRIDAAPPGARVYLYACKKNKVVNNEMFILYCMGYDMSDGRYGMCQGMGSLPDYYYQNMHQVSKLNKDNIEFLAYTPAELASHHEELKKADIVFFLAGSSGIYNQAENLLKVEEPDKANSLPFSYATDITFDEMRYIYNKVVNYKLGIVVSRPTYNSVKGKSQYKNLNNLFYMLYGMENTNIVVDGDRVYGYDNNRYYLNDPQKVADLKAEKGSAAYLWSGRMMFTDFFKSNINDHSAYSYTYQVENKEFASSNSQYYRTNYGGTNDYIRSDEFIHFIEESCGAHRVEKNGQVLKVGTLGDIAIGDVFWYKGNSWYSNVVSEWGNNTVFGDYNNFNQAKDKNGTRILDFLIKDYYGDKGFRPVSNETAIGVFANQAMIEEDGFVVQYNPYSTTGSLGWLGGVVSATNGYMANSQHDDEIVGTIELVGYAVGKDIGDGSNPNRDNGRYGLPANHENMTYEECLDAGMYYKNQFETLSNGEKGLYMTPEELEQSKIFDNGVFIYILVRSTEDLYPGALTNNNPNNPYVYYDPHQDVTNISSALPSIVSEIYAEYEGEAVKYKPVTITENGVSKTQYVTEFRAHLPFNYLDNFKAPTNYGNNRMIARIGISEGDTTQNLVFSKTRDLAGSEVFYIAIRDMFDLD